MLGLDLVFGKCDKVNSFEVITTLGLRKFNLCL